jgi:hypothetical protein
VRISKTTANWGVGTVSVLLPTVLFVLLGLLDELKLSPKDLEGFVCFTLATAFTVSAWVTLTASTLPRRRVVLLVTARSLNALQLWWLTSNAIIPPRIDIDAL